MFVFILNKSFKSLRSQHAQIRYFLKATLDRSWGFNKHAELDFTLVNKLDLNLFPLLRLPSAQTCTKKVGYFKARVVNVSCALKKSMNLTHSMLS